jgi:uncharacterized protein (UPF0335 family)
MTENKRYDVIYKKEPRGQVVTDEGIPCTARTCCTRLNRLEEENKELKEENQHIKNTIKEAYNNERTQLGKSVLKQLMEAIQ